MVQATREPADSSVRSTDRPVMRLETHFNQGSGVDTFSLLVSGALTVDAIERTTRVLNVLKEMLLEMAAAKLLAIPPSDGDRDVAAESSADSLNQTTSISLSQGE